MKRLISKEALALWRRALDNKEVAERTGISQATSRRKIGDRLRDKPELN